jgi:hypothetical protein
LDALAAAVVELELDDGGRKKGEEPDDEANNLIAD